MSQSAENTPVSNQTPAVRKSLYSNAGNFIYHISVKLHASTESIFCTHILYEDQKQGFTISK